MNQLRRPLEDFNGGEWTMRSHCTNLVDSCEGYLVNRKEAPTREAQLCYDGVKKRTQRPYDGLSGPFDEVMMRMLQLTG